MNSVRVSFCTSFFFGAAAQTRAVSKRHAKGNFPPLSGGLVPMIAVLFETCPRATRVEARSQVKGVGAKAMFARWN